MKRQIEDFTIRRIEKLAQFPPAIPLALGGLLSLIEAGLTEESSTGLGYESLLVVALDGLQVVGVLLYAVQEYRLSLTVEYGFVHPDYRRQGIYRRLWEEIKLIAAETKIKKVIGITHVNNRSMQTVMEHLGRTVSYLTYEYRMPEETE